MWFVYQGSRTDTHYLGPYSSREFVTRTMAGEFDDSVFVWTHGMDDWQQLSKQPDLELFFLELKAANDQRNRDLVRSRQKPAEEIDLALSESLDSLDFVDTPATAGVSAEDRASATADFNAFTSAVSGTASGAVAMVVDTAALASPSKTIATTYRAKAKAHPALALLSVAALVAATVWFGSTSTKAWVPRGDVTSEEFEELTRAKGDSLRFSGPSGAIALSKTENGDPLFLIATNLPNDTKFDVKIEGLAETLVDRFKYSVQTIVTVNSSLAKTSELREPDGTTLKRGAYKVTVSERGQTKILAQKVYFLGGPQDLTYQNDLHAYHAKLASQAAVELEELSQLTETIARQISESNVKYLEIWRDEKLNGPSRRYRWEKFQTNWKLLTDQFTAIVESWTPTKIENEFYYGPLYAKLQRASVRMMNIQAAQTGRMAADADRPALDATIARESLAAQTLISEIQSQTDRLKKKTQNQTKVASGSSTGLPPRDDGTKD